LASTEASKKTREDFPAGEIPSSTENDKIKGINGNNAGHHNAVLPILVRINVLAALLALTKAL